MTQGAWGGTLITRKETDLESSQQTPIRFDIGIVVITLRVMPAWLLITRSVMTTLQSIPPAGRIPAHVRVVQKGSGAPKCINPRFRIA